MSETLNHVQAAARWAGHLPAGADGETILDAIYEGTGRDRWTGKIIMPEAGPWHAPQAFVFEDGAEVDRYTLAADEAPMVACPVCQDYHPNITAAGQPCPALDDPAFGAAREAILLTAAAAILRRRWGGLATTIAVLDEKAAALAALGGGPDGEGYDACATCGAPIVATGATLGTPWTHAGDFAGRDNDHPATLRPRGSLGGGDPR